MGSAASRQTDVLVIGAGPAGIAAASVAAEESRKTLLLSNSKWLGGQIWRGEQPSQGRRWLNRLRASGAEVLTEATAVAATSPHCLVADTLTGAVEIKWEKLIIATGARELFLPFPGWTLPGVIGAGGLHALAKQGWPVEGKRIVVAGSGPLLLAVAAGLREHGADLRLIIEQSPWPKVFKMGCALMRYPSKLLQGFALKTRLFGARYRCGFWPLKAEGGAYLQSVTITNGVNSWTEPCDYLACGFHLVPNLEFAELLGCKTEGGVVKVDSFQQTSVADVFCAGEPNGIGGADCAIVEGQIAALAAVGNKDKAAALSGSRSRWNRFRRLLAEAFALRPELRKLPNHQTIVCRCEDVRYGQLKPFESRRAAKLQTRCGMGSCQGRVCGAATEFLFGWSGDSIRPPIYPVHVSTLLSQSPRPETK